MTTTITKTIPVSYETDDVKVSFGVEFGQAKDADHISNANIRTMYDVPCDIENHLFEDKTMYCLLAREGPFVLKVYDVSVVPKTNETKRKIPNGYVIYKYGITSVLDMNKQPEYSTVTSFLPSNDVERDGMPWIIHNNQTLQVDQNGEARFQWSTARALDKGVKPTPEQELMGVEERHENSGMIYITFQPIYTEETHIEEEPVTRGLSRGITRGFESSAARVGYGSKAETKSKKSAAIPIQNSRYILPIRIRNVGETSPNTKCAKDLKSAMRVEELQNRTGVLPDY